MFQRIDNLSHSMDTPVFRSLEIRLLFFGILLGFGIWDLEFV